ncbi:hypothetical protein DITRI_Ditri02bG0145300 [Diplodiscus trichospermus]
MAEALAFAALLVEGNHVRLSGQDVERGTFSHRHAMIHDQETGKKYCPLDHVTENQNEEMFTEAQFGDFANGAQVIFDQFLSSGECKWLRQTGLVVLLPHGYDGQGPEHSSARLESFLQMSGENPYKIPEMDPTQRSQIQRSNWYQAPDSLFWKGLLEERQRLKANEVTVCRVEQLCPFPYDLIQRELKRYPSIAEIVWCQEEPMNMGAYTYVVPCLCTAMMKLGRGSVEDIKYVGRAPSSATATGLLKIHQNEQAEILRIAMQPEPIKYPH